METPRGYNPIGQSAPGVARHDAPLPGHVPGSFQNIGGDTDQIYPARTGASVMPEWMRIWFTRAIFFLTTYLLVPVQAGLYPIAGIVGGIAAGVVYGIMRVGGATMDSRDGTAWMVCFLVLVPLLRIETNYETANLEYPKLRHWFRLVFALVGFTYLGVHEQHDSLGAALLGAALATAVLHFVLKWKFLRIVWHNFQMDGWVRRRDNP